MFSKDCSCRCFSDLKATLLAFFSIRLTCNKQTTDKFILVKCFLVRVNKLHAQASKGLFICARYQAGSVTGTNSVVCSYGIFQPSRLEWNSRDKTKMVKHKFVSFASFVASWTLVTLLKKVNSHTYAVETHTGQKLRYFGRYVKKAKLFCQKCFISVTRAGVFLWETVHPDYRDLCRNKPGQLGFSCVQIEI